MGSWEPIELGDAGEAGRAMGPADEPLPLPVVLEGNQQESRLVLVSNQPVPGGLAAWETMSLAPPARLLDKAAPDSAERFRSCRNYLIGGVLVLDLDALTRAAGPRLSPLGLENLRLGTVALPSGKHALELGATSHQGSGRAEITIAFGLEADAAQPWRVRATATSVRVDGPLSLSRPQLVAAILSAVAGPSQDEPTFDPAGDAAFALFTDRGWRAPSRERLRFVEALPRDTRKLALRFDDHESVGRPTQSPPAATRTSASAPATSPATSPPSSPRRLLLHAAEAAEALGDLDGAESALAQAAGPRVEDDQTNDDARLERATASTHLAHVLEKRGRLEAAKRTAEMAVDLAPAYAPALALLGDLAQRLGDNARAHVVYTALARASGVRGLMTPGALAARQGKVAAALGRWDEAGEHFATAVKHNPQDPEARHALAEMALRRGDFPEAARQFEEELRLLPLDAPERLAQVRHRLGDALARLGDWGGARYHLELVVSQDPQRAEAWETLADVTARLGLPEQTAAAFERLSRIYRTAEKRAEALFRRGEVLREKLDDRAGALDAYLKASDLYPSHAGTAARLVEAFWRIGDYESLTGLSSDLFETGQIVDAPPSIRLRLILGMALARRDSSPAADEALANLPWDPADVTEAMIEAADNLADGPVAGLDPLLTSLLRWRGPLAEHSLRETLKAAWRADPSRPGVLRALAWLADRSGDEPTARVLYALVAFLEPQTSPALVARLVAMGPSPPARPEALELGGPANHADCVGRSLPLRRAMARLAAPLQGFAQGPLGIAPRDDEGVPRDRNVLARRLARLLGVPPVRFVVTPTPAGRRPHVSVGFEPTRPATLRIPREALAVNDGELTFLLARALDVTRNGLGSLADRPAEDIAAFLQGAMAAHDQQDAPDQPLAKAAKTWLSQAEQSEAMQAGGDSVAIRDELTAAEHTLSTWDAFLRGAEQATNRFALLTCRSPLDALRALARLDLDGATDLEGLPRSKRQEILRTAPLRGLVEFMLSPAYAACLDARMA